MRGFSSIAEPHRDLVRLPENYQRGDDVRALEGAARLRLEARDLRWRPIGRDGILGPEEFDRIVVAARHLGARESTLQKEDHRGRPILTVGVQRMIREPENRTADQLVRAHERQEKLLRERDAREQRLSRVPSSVLKPTPAQRAEVRRLAHAAFQLAYLHKGAVHYTMGPERWQGIAHELRAAAGRYPTQADCSAMYTWAMWNALTHVFGSDVADVVNGAAWRGGYTGTLLSHGWGVSMGALEVGDAVIYGNGFPGEHVAMYVGGGCVLSHGSDAGPFLLPVRYRGDVMQARRYI
jgi:hypothetical protein